MKVPPAKVVYDNKLKIVEEMRRSRENPKNLKRKIVYQYRDEFFIYVGPAAKSGCSLYRWTSIPTSANST